MSLKIAIINCYSDEPESAPSAKYFCEYIDNPTIINICHYQKIDDLCEFDGYIISGSRSCHKDKNDWTSYLINIINMDQSTQFNHILKSQYQLQSKLPKKILKLLMKY